MTKENQGGIVKYMMCFIIFICIAFMTFWIIGQLYLDSVDNFSTYYVYPFENDFVGNDEDEATP